MKFSEKFGKMESNILLDLDEAKKKLEAQGFYWYSLFSTR